MRAYKRYNATSIPWMSQTPSTWCVARGKTVFMNNKVLNREYQSHNVLSLTLKGVINNNTDNPIGLSPKDYATYQLFCKNDLVFKLIDLENYKTSRVGLVHENGIMSSAYIRLSQKNDIHNIRYLYLVYYDLYLRGVYNNLGAGVRSTLSAGDLLSIPIPLPPREEQDQIVRYLDWKISRINKLINAKRRQIELLRERKRVMINEAVTMQNNNWRSIRIKEAAKILRGKFTHRPRNDPDFYDGDYPFIQTGNVARAGKYIYEYQQTLNDRGYSVSKLFPKGTLTMAIAANIGDVAILSFDACFPDSIIGFIPYIGIDLEYLYYALSNMKADFVKEAPVNTQGNLSVERVGAMRICAPNEDEQHEVVRHIESKALKIDRLIDIARSEITLLAEYRTRLVSDIVTGKLDVRGVVVPKYEAVEDVAEDENEALDEETMADGEE